MIQEISYTRLTLALDIIKKLSSGPYQGYHELGIVKQKISLGDTITIRSADKMNITCDYPGVPEDETNICWQAAQLLKQEFNISENVEIDIKKEIPVQGGLAGGSTNAATTINLLDKYWELNLDLSQKIRLGRTLGMDVPFYFTGSCAFDTEATGVLNPIKSETKLYFLLVVPPFGVSTADAYGGIDYTQVGQRADSTKMLISALKRGAYDEIVSHTHNDFELSVFPVHKALFEIRQKLLNSGADAAFMSGSGSTMVGIFDSLAKVEHSASFFGKKFIVHTL